MRRRDNSYLSYMCFSNRWYDRSVVMVTLGLYICASYLSNNIALVVLGVNENNNRNDVVRRIEGAYRPIIPSQY